MSMGTVLRRFARGAWKFALVAAIAAVAVYFVRFRPVAVETYPVRTATVQAEVLGTGTLEARLKVTVSSKIVGRLATLPVDQNDRIALGQLLATLDDGDLRQQMEVASAALEAVRAAIPRAEAEVTRAGAVLTQAKVDFERTQRLFERKVASGDELDKSRERLDVAAADVHRAEAAKTEAEYQVAAASRTLQYHQERLADTRLSSPFDNGLVLIRYREAGDVVVPGTAIMDLACLDEIWVSAWVHESAMASLAVGQKARVVFRSDPERSYPGRVVRLARQADRETRELLVDVQVEELPAHWAVGQRAEVYISTGRKDNVPTVPPQVVLWNNGRPSVFVDDGGRARRREVTLGLRGRDLVEVTGGLQVGEVVVSVRSEDSGTLREGARIQP